MDRSCFRPWLMLEKTTMRMTPRTMSAVPRISDVVTAVCQRISRQAVQMQDSRVPTSQYANRKLNTRLDAPRGATQSGRRYRSASGEPTGVSIFADEHGRLRAARAAPLSSIREWRRRDRAPWPRLLLTHLRCTGVSACLSGIITQSSPTPRFLKAATNYTTARPLWPLAPYPAPEAGSSLSPGSHHHPTSHVSQPSD